jgi:hypothetical protein
MALRPGSGHMDGEGLGGTPFYRREGGVVSRCPATAGGDTLLRHAVALWHQPLDKSEVWLATCEKPSSGRWDKRGTSQSIRHIVA